MSSKRSESQTPKATKSSGAPENQMTELLGQMTSTLTNLGGLFNTFNEQADGFRQVQLPMPDTPSEIQNLQRELRQHEETHDGGIEEIRRNIQEDVQNRISQTMTVHIKEQMRAEIVKQVKEQVDSQIVEHIPVSLRQQAAEGKKQLEEVKASLINSESRISNSNVDVLSLDESLATVLTPEGTRSDYFPADLRSLYSYDNDATKKLVKDYGLVEAEESEMNIKRFLMHIGKPKV